VHANVAFRILQIAGDDLAADQVGAARVASSSAITVLGAGLGLRDVEATIFCLGAPWSVMK
jgi:hypothetical protein